LNFQGNSDDSIDRNKARAKLLAHLISMPIQLYHLRLRNFEWLLHLIQYVSISYVNDFFLFLKI